MVRDARPHSPQEAGDDPSHPSQPRKSLGVSMAMDARVVGVAQGRDAELFEQLLTRFRRLR